MNVDDILEFIVPNKTVDTQAPKLFPSNFHFKKSESLQTEGRHFGSKICKFRDV